MISSNTLISDLINAGNDAATNLFLVSIFTDNEDSSPLRFRATDVTIPSIGNTTVSLPYQNTEYLCIAPGMAFTGSSARSARFCCFCCWCGCLPDGYRPRLFQGGEQLSAQKRCADDFPGRYIYNRNAAWRKRRRKEKLDPAWRCSGILWRRNRRSA